MALVSSALTSDLDSFNTLVPAYQNLVYNVAFRILCESFAADDATWQAFILAFCELSSFRGGSSYELCENIPEIVELCEKL